MIAKPVTQEKPQNGIKGLKHWRYDLLAGMQVALVSLPLSLGIAIASGAPAVTGVISAIIAGLIFPFLGGAYVTISGPAAGLAPALLAGMIMLGGGDLAAGYPLLLVAICLTGLLQILLSVFKAGRFALFLPVTVVEGMLAAIGIIIIIKQIPALLGVIAPPAKSMLVTIVSLPSVLQQTDLAIAVIGGICLFLLFYLNGTRHSWLRRIPPPLFVAGVGIGFKSRVNVDAGGRTLWANFYNAIFLIIFLFLAKDLIARIPLAAIGAILVYVGWRLCEFSVFRKTYAIGRDQMLIFVATIVAILATDLLYGILLGVAAEITLLVYLLTPSFRAVLTGRQTFPQSYKLLWGNFTGLFRNPVIKVSMEGSTEQPHCRISLGSIVCFNLLPLDKLLQTIPPGAGVTLAITESGRIIDHTAMEYLHQFQEECQHAGRAFEIQGLENFYQFTTHSLSSRMHDAKLIKEKVRFSAREQQMSKVAQLHKLPFAPAIVAMLNRHDFIYLRRGSDRQKSNVMSGEFHGCYLSLYDYSHTAAPDYYAEHHHTIVHLRRLETDDMPWPNLVITPGHYLERYLVEYQEVDIMSRPALSQHYRLYALNPQQALAWMDLGIERLLAEHPGFYIELRDNFMLVFHPEHDLESPEAIELLLAFAESLAHRGHFSVTDKPEKDITR